ncbi:MULTISPECIES: hypothetical protein [Azospirillum]|uniref:Uncharacterized protein n=1 Tax=Azospirillum himalayense TaxID=654847 RepID=A0ABW0GFY0_9PROT|nr:hypothetical protein [Azospirillum brasilense]NUB27210.1 hypothetical protein [Azospirillum brasilense]NUB30550.1 hypothetical protein [Azospirillum brasilense]RIW07778.1 hypothetical protein D2T81_02760 [Azospirillum brasilense]
MATLSVQDTSEVGAALTYSNAAGGGDDFVNASDRIVLHVKNGSASPINVTIAAQTVAASVPGLGIVSKANQVVAVPAGGDRIIGPFPARAFNNPSTSKVSVSYSATTTVTVAAFRVPAL